MGGIYSQPGRKTGRMGRVFCAPFVGRRYEDSRGAGTGAGRGGAAGAGSARRDAGSDGAARGGGGATDGAVEEKGDEAGVDAEDVDVRVPRPLRDAELRVFKAVYVLTAGNTIRDGILEMAVHCRQAIRHSLRAERPSIQAGTKYRTYATIPRRLFGFAKEEARRIFSIYDMRFTYRLGHPAVARDDGEPTEIVNLKRRLFTDGCGVGIHFFADVDSACRYHNIANSAPLALIADGGDEPGVVEALRSLDEQDVSWKPLVGGAARGGC